MRKLIEMKKIVILAIPFIISCTHNNKSTQGTDNINSTNKKYIEFNSLIGKAFKTEASKNPFLKGNFHLNTDTCNQLEPIVCKIKRLKKIQFPVELGPKPEIQYYPHFECIEDTMFEIVTLDRAKHVKDTREERTSCYYYGGLLKETENYFLFFTLYGDGDAEIYYLFTANKKGEYIDELAVGGLIADYQEIYSKIDSDNAITVLTNNFDWKGNKAAIKESIKKQYMINSNGKFKEF